MTIKCPRKNDAAAEGLGGRFADDILLWMTWMHVKTAKATAMPFSIRIVGGPPSVEKYE